MRAAVFNGLHSIEVADRPDRVVAEPTDAVVRVVPASACGSDLRYYSGESPHPVGPIGHEFIGWWSRSAEVPTASAHAFMASVGPASSLLSVEICIVGVSRPLRATQHRRELRR